MDSPITKKIQVNKEYYVQFTDEELLALKMEKNQKFTCHVEDNGIKLVPFETIDLDMDEWPVELLHFLIRESCDQDISVNEVITNILEDVLKKEHTNA